MRQSRAFALSALAAVIAFIVMTATEPWLAMGWDEGYTLGRLQRLRWWLTAYQDPAKFSSSWQTPTLEMVQPTNAPSPLPHQLNSHQKLFDPKVMDWFWPFSKEEPHGHPPFYALAGLLGDWLTPDRESLERARLGSMIFYSLAAGAIAGLLAMRFGFWAALVGFSAWMFQPRLFAEGHYATYDAILSCLWLLAILTFASLAEFTLKTKKPEEPQSPTSPKSRRISQWSLAILFGIVLGCAAATKFTGCILILPFLVWASFQRSNLQLMKWAGLGCFIALIVMVLCNPHWWNDPISGVERFVKSNLTRSRTINIQTLYLGSVYNTPKESLPWHNTLVWTLFVTPAGFLALAIWGMVRTVRQWKTESLGMLALGHWLFLIILRSMPHTPGHDGVRQFLPAFGCLAILAALGSVSLIERWGRWGKVAVTVAIIEALVGLALIMPTPLSYYSPQVGFLPGATKLGMEPTYFWDSMDEESLRWLNENTSANRSVAFASFPTNWLYLKQVGQLKVSLAGVDRPLFQPQWYVIQNRPGAMSEADRKLIASEQPAHTVIKQGVPLLWIFPYEKLNARRP